MSLSVMLLRRVATPPVAARRAVPLFKHDGGRIQEQTGLGADTGSGGLRGEEFENQLTHTLFIFWLKF